MSPNNNDDFFYDLPELDEHPVKSAANVAPQPDQQPEEKLHNMIFTCLKCQAESEIEYSHMPENGLTIPCFSCKTRIIITRESCANRAAQKTRELFCVKCGHQLDHHAHCPGCGVPFPDYFLVQNPEEAKRQAKRIRAASAKPLFSGFDFSALTGVFARKTPKEKGRVFAPTPEKRSAVAKTAAVISPKVKKLLIAGAVICAIAAIGWGIYFLKGADQQYVDNYFKALYGIKMGAEDNIKTCRQISTAMNSGRLYSAGTNVDDDVRADKTKNAVDKLILQLQKPPSKYSQANAKLLELNKIYSDLYALKGSKPVVAGEFGSAVDKLDQSFKKTTQDLKAALPEKLQEELKIAKTKYRGFDI